MHNHVIHTMEPTFIYKLVQSQTPIPESLPDKLPLSELDASSGFIHLSTAKQIPGTLKHFFGAEDKVYVLRIKYTTVEKDIKWEDPNAQVCGERGGEGFFPHLYNGGRLGSAEIDSVVVWERKGSWDEALKTAEAWLI
ncbi:hypothetical protein FB45DRAFT_408880 [Roridomyces roridus]|uniref:DUF952 domain protein n=1 Tax=Roridomyces roridus TaxID=1738132 RepID=A0AAD7FUX1_9AGAR|nr:hypothetical protein FB45DRAFT_408880 [Roridomyces roridus]